MFDRRIKTDISVKITCEQDEENAVSIQKRQRYLAGPVLDPCLNSTEIASLLPRPSLKKWGKGYIGTR